MKIKIDCNAVEITNGFLSDNLQFTIFCKIKVFEYENKPTEVPFDSEDLKVRIEDSELSDKVKEKLLKDDLLEDLVSNIIFKTIDKVNINYSEVMTI